MRDFLYLNVLNKLIFISFLSFTGCSEEPFVARIGCQNDYPFQKGAEMALRHLAEARHPVRLEVLFDKYSTDPFPKSAVKSAYYFCEDRTIQAVVGYASSDASLATARVFNQNKMVQIIPYATSCELNDTGEWTFRLCPDDRYQSKFLVKVARNHFGARRCALIYQNNDYGRGLSDLFCTRWKEGGGSIVFKAPASSGMAKKEVLDVYVDEIIAQNPDLLIFICSPYQTALIKTELDRRKASFPLLGSDAMDNRHVFNQYRNLFDGMGVALFYHHLFPNKENQTFVKYFRESTGEFPIYNAALAYDAVLLLHRAFSSGVRTREELKSYLQGVGTLSPPFNGVAGQITFNENRICSRPLYLGTIQSDRMALVRDLSKVRKQGMK